MSEETDIKIRALAKHLGVAEDTITDEGDDRYSSTEDPGEYWVLTDAEADEAWEEYLDSYLDDCILCELKGPLTQYFDRDAWKHDARHDGRGHCLSAYDGEEHEEQINGTWYYIYRTN